MNRSASYRAPSPPDTIDTTDKTLAGVGAAVGSVSSVRCVSGKTKPIGEAALGLGKLPPARVPAAVGELLAAVGPAWWPQSVP